MGRRPLPRLIGDLNPFTHRRRHHAMIRRRFAIALLALGTVAGYGSALCSWSHPVSYTHLTLPTNREV